MTLDLPCDLPFDLIPLPFDLPCDLTFDLIPLTSSLCPLTYPTCACKTYNLTVDRSPLSRSKCSSWSGPIQETWADLPQYLSAAFLPKNVPHVADHAPLVNLTASLGRRGSPYQLDVGRRTSPSLMDSSFIANKVLGPTTEVEPHLGRLIGVGGFGKVYESSWRGQRVAVKIVTCETETQFKSLAKEVELCGRFRNCARVVKLLAACLAPPDFRAAPIPASSNFRAAHLTTIQSVELDTRDSNDSNGSSSCNKGGTGNRGSDTGMNQNSGNSTGNTPSPGTGQASPPAPGTDQTSLPVPGRTYIRTPGAVQLQAALSAAPRPRTNRRPLSIMSARVTDLLGTGQPAGSAMPSALKNKHDRTGTADSPKLSADGDSPRLDIRNPKFEHRPGGRLREPQTGTAFPCARDCSNDIRMPFPYARVLQYNIRIAIPVPGTAFLCQGTAFPVPGGTAFPVP
eukprot:gene20553-27343_t